MDTASLGLLHVVRIDQWPNDALIHLNLLASTTRNTTEIQLAAGTWNECGETAVYSTEFKFNWQNDDMQSQ